MIELVRRLRDDSKLAVLFSAHELNPLLGAIDRVLYLGSGQAAIGTVEEVITAPVLSRLYGTRRSTWCASAGASSSWPAASTSNTTRIATIARHDHGHPMLHYDFMRTAFAASGIVAVVAGAVGYLPGAAGADLRRPRARPCRLRRRDRRGPDRPLAARRAASSSPSPPASAMGLLGERLARRDVAIGMVLSLSLGLGLLFLHFYTAHGDARRRHSCSATCSASTADARLAGAPRRRQPRRARVHRRPLIFATLQPELAEAKGVPLRLVGGAVPRRRRHRGGRSSQIVGVLLVFTLMVGPAATARRLTAAPRRRASRCRPRWRSAEPGAASFSPIYTDWPTSFWITLLSVAVYGLSFMPGRQADSAAAAHAHHHGNG